MRPQGRKDAYKRKRKASALSPSCSIENYLTREKRSREERISGDETTEERSPLTELPVLRASNERPSTDSKPQSEENSKSSDPTRASPSETCESKEACSASIRRPKHGEILDAYLRQKEKSSSQIRADLFLNHTSLRPRMRSVLLEWILEVADVYKLHRETYFLAVDYIDRYLSLTTDITKNQLQLIGITSLLLAAKYEEIYPPKISEFAYITDGACTDEDIKKMEVILVKVIGWMVSVKTPESWISAFLQLMYYDKFPGDLNIHLPQFSGALFRRASCLLDLMSLDEGFIKFHYKIIATTVLFLTVSKSMALSASGLKFSDIADCLNWFQPFWEIVREKFGFEDVEDDSLFDLDKPIKPNDFSHAVLTHRVSLEMLEGAQSLQEARERESSFLLTPPASSEKPPNFVSKTACDTKGKSSFLN